MGVGMRMVSVAAIGLASMGYGLKARAEGPSLSLSSASLRAPGVEGNDNISKTTREYGPKNREWINFRLGYLIAHRSQIPGEVAQGAAFEFGPRVYGDFRLLLGWHGFLGSNQPATDNYKSVETAAAKVLGEIPFYFGNGDSSFNLAGGLVMLGSHTKDYFGGIVQPSVDLNLFRFEGNKGFLLHLAGFTAIAGDSGRISQYGLIGGISLKGF